MIIPVWSGNSGAFDITRGGTMPSVTALKDGSFIVVWTQANAQGATDIRAQLYEASGIKHGSEFTIGGTAGNERDPAVTALANGGFAVTWEDRTTTSVRAAVFGLEREQDGTPKRVGENFEVAQGTATNDHANSSVTALPDGGFVVSVTGSRVGTTTNAASSYIYGLQDTRYLLKGTSEFTRSGGLTRDTDVAALQTASGAAYVTVASFAGSGNITHKVAAEIWTVSGQKIKDVFEVATMTATEDLPAVSVATLKGGQFLVAWTFQNSVQAKIYNADGTGGENTIELHRSGVSGSEVILYRITVEALGSGFALGFQESLRNGTNSEVYVKTFDKDGKEIFSRTTPYDDNALPLTQAFPSMAVLEDGRLIVSWYDSAGLHGRFLDPRTEAIDFKGTDLSDEIYGTDITTAGDTLDGGFGDDTLTSGAGDDIFYRARSGANTSNGADHFNGGEGKDIVSYWWIRNAGADTTGIKIYMDHSSDSTGAATGDVYNSIEVIDGTLYDDTIEGNADANAFWGSDGHDSLAGGAGNDTLNGDLGNDTLNGGTGNNLSLGGEGNDLMLAAEGGKDTFVGGTGEDKISYFFAGPIALYMHGEKVNTGAAAGDTYDSIEIIDGTFHADIIEGTTGNQAFWGANGNDILKGRDGSDILKGGGDSDTLHGGMGADTLDGESGFDWASYTDAAGAVSVSLVSGRGATGEAAGDMLVQIEGVIGSRFDDTLAGGAHELRGGLGNDIYQVSAGTTLVESTGQGRDTVIASGSYSLALAAEVEILTLASSNGMEAYALTGSDSANTISGNAGANTLKGLGGNDTLSGGLGKDVLAGDTGKDIFVFDTKANRKTNLDRIVDFSVKDDGIWLENKVFAKLGKKGSVSKPAKLSKDFFTVGDKAKDSNDHLIYDKKKGVLLYDADGSGAGKAVEIATLKKNLKMTSADFFVI